MTEEKMYAGDTSMIRKRGAHRDGPEESAGQADPVLCQVQNSKIKQTHRRSSRSISASRILLAAAFVSLSAAFYDGVFLRQRRAGHTGGSNSATRSTKSEPSCNAEAPEKPIDWSRCKASPAPKTVSKPDKRIEPLWLPTYPTSLPEGYDKFIVSLTGVSTASRNYYRQSKSLRRCHAKYDQANVDGVTCEVVHPIVPCERPHPSAQAGSFGKVVLLAIRNPLTAFPAFHQEKQNKYHNVQGQVPKEAWIKFRDEYLDNKALWKEWRGFIEEWRGMDPYHVAAYLPHEDWGDETRGPALVEELAGILAQEEFPVLYEKSEGGEPSGLACLWYGQIHEAIAERERTLKDWYVPEYTGEQLRGMAADLDDFARELKTKEGTGDSRPGDEQLISILSGYRDAVNCRMK